MVITITDSYLVTTIAITYTVITIADSYLVITIAITYIVIAIADTSHTHIVYIVITIYIDITI